MYVICKSYAILYKGHRGFTSCGICRGPGVNPHRYPEVTIIPLPMKCEALTSGTLIISLLIFFVMYFAFSYALNPPFTTIVYSSMCLKRRICFLSFDNPMWGPLDGWQIAS